MRSDRIHQRHRHLRRMRIEGRTVTVRIRSKKAYEKALKEFESLWDCKICTPGAARRMELADALDAYERKHFPIDPPSKPEGDDVKLSVSARDLPAAEKYRVCGCQHSDCEDPSHHPDYWAKWEADKAKARDFIEGVVAERTKANTEFGSMVEKAKEKRKKPLKKEALAWASQGPETPSVLAWSELPKTISRWLVKAGRHVDGQPVIVAEYTVYSETEDGALMTASQYMLDTGPDAGLWCEPPVLIGSYDYSTNRIVDVEAA